ncbi:MAG: DUF523 domain-containing protein [Deltaproteobacteria bacterium]|nr:DUF523 domain-containing protein [Deltaproteobacteria bacterium]
MMKSADRLRVGVSHCLLGAACRYDGGSAELRLLEEILGARCVLIPVCPEVEIGLPVPREKILLVGPREAPEVLGEESGRTFGERLRTFARGWLLGVGELHGFVLQSRSPSCGVGSCWRRERRESEPLRDGTGLFAEVLLATHPGLPVREDTDLPGAAACRAFLAEVEAYASRREKE